MSYQQTIYNMLRKAGMTEAGALGVLGNWWCESNCEPYRVQNDNSSFRTISKDYTLRVNNGSISRQQFGSDERGYGLAQWTYVNKQKTHGRKFELYDFWKSYGGSIDDLQMQVEFALKEFKRDFIADWRLLCSTTDIDEAAKAVCLRFENPAVKNIFDRQKAAKALKAELDLGQWEGTEVVVPSTDTKPEPGWEQIPATEFWPPRVICYGMKGADVLVAKTVLFARGWLDDFDGDYFDKDMESIVKAFQKAVFPSEPKEWDGIIGNKTWTKLLERGE